MLIDAYDLVAASPRLAGVKVKAFGDETVLEQPGANPRMVWIQTSDSFGPPDTLSDVRYIIDAAGQRQPTIVGGRQVALTSKFLRAAGARIHLFTDYGPNGQRQMEALINELVMALYETELAPGMNFALGTAEWFPRSAISNNSIEVVVTITVGVPIWDAQPAQLLGAVDAAGSRATTP